MKSLANKLIVYDSNCKVCSSLREVVLRLTTIPESKVKAYRELDAGTASQVDAGKFRNVMALVDTTGGNTLYGSEGIAYIFSSQYRAIDLLFRFRSFVKLFDFLYKTQAYNRYIIATPKSRFKCDCFPDRVVSYRLSYIGLCLVFAIALTALFGMSLTNFVPGLTRTDAAVQMLLMAGTGWVAQILMAVAFLRDRALDYIGHLGSIMVVGLLILVPGILFGAITGVHTVWVPLLSVFTSSAVMLYLHIHRASHLGLSPRWTLSWFAFLQAGAFLWIYVFHLKQAL